MHMPGTQERSAGRAPATRFRLAAGGAVLAALTAGCASNQISPELGLPASTVTVDAITANPDRYEGRLVSVSGEIDRVFGERWFSIGGEEFGGDELLVVGPTTVPAIVNTLGDSLSAMNDVVQVTGYVRVFDEEAIEDEVNTDIGEEWWEEYEREAVLVMTDMDVSPRIDVIPAVPVAVPVPVAPIVDELVIVDAPDPAALAGRSTALIGVTVQTVVGDGTFWVGPSPDRQLFVVLDAAAASAVDIEPGQRIAVAGVLTAMPDSLAPVRTSWNLTSANAAMLSQESIYLAANDVEVLAAASDATGRAER
ncbi:MAG TPA: hypothetical protein VGE02_04925 [Gemmatimonadales bacterium]